MSFPLSIILTQRLWSCIRRLWDSPTFTAWGSMGARALNLVLVLPLLLTRLTTAEIAVFYLINTLIAFQGLADFGFGMTLTRMISYAMGGASQLTSFRELENCRGSGQPHWAMVERICRLSRFVYICIAVVFVSLLAVLGSWALYRPIVLAGDAPTLWLAWMVALSTLGFSLYGMVYNNYLRGINQVALVNRWDAIFSLLAMVSNFVVLLAGGRLCALILSSQIWLIAIVIRNYFLSRHVEAGHFATFGGPRFDQGLLSAVWPASWRSGVGFSAAYGVSQASGVVFAQIGSSANVAAYLLSLRFLDLINNFSTAPFYSKLPILARLRAEGRLREQVAWATRGMRWAYWSFVLPALAVGVLAPVALELIGSHASFVPPLLWAVMIFGVLLERYGAMHLQLYSITNHIIMHIVGVGFGLIYIAVCLLLLPFVGLYAFPLGTVAGHLFFYSWIAPRYSYRSLRVRAWDFDKGVFLPPLTVMVGYIVLCFVVGT